MAVVTGKILICDDSLLVRKKLKECLEKLGNFEITEVATGSGAIEAYKSQKPQLVFMDIVVPETNGIEALKEIRAYDNSANVVIISSTGTQVNFKDAIDAGAYDFIQKPWKDTQIQAIVEKIFGKRGETGV